MRMFSVGVMNSSKEITEMLVEVLIEEGMDAHAIFTYDIKNDENTFDEFIKQYKPRVIIYDIAIPYVENYNLFKRIMKRPSAKDIRFILTTTNKHVLDKLVGKTDAYEIVGKPFDLEMILNAVKSAGSKNKTQPAESSAHL